MTKLVLIISPPPPRRPGPGLDRLCPRLPAASARPPARTKTTPRQPRRRLLALARRPGGNSAGGTGPGHILRVTTIRGCFSVDT